MKKNIAVLLFNDFETLDVFGPVEIFGRLSDLYTIKFYSLTGGIITNSHSVQIDTEKLNAIDTVTDVFLIPGGVGTRTEVNNVDLIDNIRRISNLSKYVLTVCTGSALLAKTGLLDQKSATSNKRAFDWVITNGENVLWNSIARWVVDGKYYTSSGVSAGIDMTLGFVCDMFGSELSKKIALEIEYNWIDNKDDDTFKIKST